MPSFVLPLLVAIPLGVSALVALVTQSMRFGWNDNQAGPLYQAGSHARLGLLAGTYATVAGLLWWCAASLDDSGFIVHTVGGYNPGVGIPFVFDHAAAFMLVAVLVMSSLALVGAHIFEDISSHPHFSTLVLLLIAGVNGAILTGDLFNLFVFVEVMLLPSYALVAIAGSWRRLAVGRLFVVINLLTSTVLLAGVGLVYATAGTVNIAALSGAAQDPMVAIATGLILLALAIKAGIAPVHGWLPRTYPEASASVMALFAGIHTKVSIFVFIRIWAVIFDVDGTMLWTILVLALVSMVWGSLAANGMRYLREVFAYLMVAGVGTIFMIFSVSAIAASTFAHSTGVLVIGVTATLMYLLHHMFTVGALIATSGAVEHQLHTDKINRLRGIGMRAPLFMGLLAVGMASLAGLPFTSGMIAKLQAVLLLVSVGSWWSFTALGVLIVSSLFTLVVLVFLGSQLVWGKTNEHVLGSSSRAGVPTRLLWPAVITMCGVVALFIGAPVVTGWAELAASALVNTSGYVTAVGA